MLVRFNKKFAKQREKAPKKIKLAFDERLVIFYKDKFDPQLNNHSLSGKLKGHRSITVTGDWRAIYYEENDKIIFVLLGTHSQLYK